MDKPKISDKSAQKSTGKVLDEWFAILEQADCNKMTHKQIAAYLYEYHQVSAWWAQTITVEYERYIGRREVGQSCQGDYQAGASKTINGTMDTVFNAWLDFAKDIKSLNNKKLTNTPSTSTTDKWRYWRTNIDDGSKVNVMFNQKAPGKEHLSVTHEKLTSTDAVDDWKIFWKVYVKEFSEQL